MKFKEDSNVPEYVDEIINRHVKNCTYTHLSNIARNSEYPYFYSYVSYQCHYVSLVTRDYKKFTGLFYCLLKKSNNIYIWSDIENEFDDYVKYCYKELLPGRSFKMYFYAMKYIYNEPKLRQLTMVIVNYSSVLSYLIKYSGLDPIKYFKYIVSIFTSGNKSCVTNDVYSFVQTINKMEYKISDELLLQGVEQIIKSDECEYLKPGIWDLIFRNHILLKSEILIKLLPNIGNDENLNIYTVIENGGGEYCGGIVEKKFNTSVDKFVSALDLFKKPDSPNFTFYSDKMINYAIEHSNDIQILNIHKL